MTRMEKRRRRRRIARIRAVTVVFTLLAATFTVVAISGTGAADSNLDVEQVTRTLVAEPVLLAAEQEPMTVDDMTLRALPDELGEPVEEADESELIEQALLEQGYLHEEIPLDYDLQCHLIAVCEEYEVPLKIALGVIQAESSFRADAQNGSCYGYMQINSINESWLAERIGVTDLTEPYQNIRSGVYILSDLYSKQGDWHRALICYNYGESGAQKHVFSQGYTTTAYSRTVMGYADEWAEVLG